MTVIGKFTDWMKALKVPMIFGTFSDGNYTEIELNGTDRKHGNAQGHDDLAFPLSGANLYSVAGKVDFDWDKNATVFQAGGSFANKGDRAQGKNQYLHKFRFSISESDLITLQPHFHWKQYNDTDQYIFKVRYRISNNGDSGKSDWSDFTELTVTTCNGNDIFPFSLDAGDDFMQQITTFGLIDVYIGLSAEVEIMATRTDVGSYTEDLEITTIDFHAPVDKIGSRNMSTD